MYFVVFWLCEFYWDSPLPTNGYPKLHLAVLETVSPTRKVFQEKDETHMLLYSSMGDHTGIPGNVTGEPDNRKRPEAIVLHVVVVGRICNQLSQVS